MSDSENIERELESPNPLRRLYNRYAAGVAYISVIDAKGDEKIGSCFHIGDGVFVTARHVVQEKTIKEIGTTIAPLRYFETDDTRTTGMASIDIPYSTGSTSNFIGPFFHPDKKIDVAALIIPDLKAPALLLGDHLDDWLGNEHVLSPAVILGYPPIPFAREPILIASKCEVNAIVDKYTGGHPHFILSSMARGGFSGGPAISIDGLVLGVITESLTSENQPTELGYLSVLSVEGIYTCISHHHIVPKHIDEQWDGFWNTETISFESDSANHVSVDIYRGNELFYFKIYSYRPDIINQTLEVIDHNFNGLYSLTWIHELMIKVEFKKGTIDEEIANQIYGLIVTKIDASGLKRSRINFVEDQDC